MRAGVLLLFGLSLSPSWAAASTTPSTLVRTVRSAYPVLCADRVGDARYAQGDLVAASVAVRGSGLRFSWTTAQAPYLFAGDEIIYSATFYGANPTIVATLYADVLNITGSKNTSTVSISTPARTTIQVGGEARFGEQGKTFTVTVPRSRLSGFTGDVQTARLRDGGVLTGGRWILAANRGPTAGSAPGTDDTCGEDNKHRVS